jgi:hypothetical protein
LKSRRDFADGVVGFVSENSSTTQLLLESAMNAGPADMKLEVVAIPVSDVDRSKSFYSKLGWRLDADFVVGDTFRGVQFTPPALRPQSTSAKESLRLSQARHKDYF